jgi:hypothetical protein
VLKLAQNLESLKTQFTDETDAEQAELDKLKPELEAAVEKMFADQKVYQHAQNGLTAEVNKLSEEEHKHGAEATIEVRTSTTCFLLPNLTIVGRHKVVQRFASQAYLCSCIRSSSCRHSNGNIP